jgi:hypothetical protein
VKLVRMWLQPVRVPSAKSLSEWCSGVQGSVGFELSCLCTNGSARISSILFCFVVSWLDKLK